MTGAVVWITGLPASGKSTLAERAAATMRDRGIACCILDSDHVRESLVPAPGYTDAARGAFYTTLARLAALFEKQGLVVLVPATANLRSYRAAARDLARRFVEIYVDTAAVECEARDPKGLYAAARSHSIEGLPGAGATYEIPAAPCITAHGGHDDDAIETLMAMLSRTPSA